MSVYLHIYIYIESPYIDIPIFKKRPTSCISWSSSAGVDGLETINFVITASCCWYPSGHVRTIGHERSWASRKIRFEALLSQQPGAIFCVIPQIQT